MARDTWTLVLGASATLLALVLVLVVRAVLLLLRKRPFSLSSSKRVRTMVVLGSGASRKQGGGMCLQRVDLVAQISGITLARVSQKLCALAACERRWTHCGDDDADGRPG